jgi:hypothetical protein
MLLALGVLPPFFNVSPPERKFDDSAFSPFHPGERVPLRVRQALSREPSYVKAMSTKFPVSQKIPGNVHSLERKDNEVDYERRTEALKLQN